MACASGPNGQRSMWSLCEQCGAISMIDKDWLTRRLNFWNHRYLQQSAHADITLLSCFYPFFIADFPPRLVLEHLPNNLLSATRRCRLTPSLATSNPVLAPSPSPPSVPSPRVSHNRKRKKVHMLRFRPPRLLALSLLVYYNALYHKDMGNKHPTINYLDSRKAPKIVLWVSLAIDGADSCEDIRRRCQIVIWYYHY